MRIRYEDIQERVEAYNPGADFDLLRRAYLFTAREHRGQVRQSGEPYLVHPLAVAAILAELRLDIPCIAVGLLHDVVEDTLTTVESIEEYFGPDIAHMVAGVTKLGKLKFRSQAEQEAENLRKMFLAMVDDIRVIMVKLADRLHNMRTLNFLPEHKRHRIAAETREIYAPIAHRLGIGKIKVELEDLCLQHLDPEGYASLIRQLALKRKVSEGFIEEITQRIDDAVRDNGIEPQITGRIKSAASIHAKLRRQKIRVEQVYDYVAFRLIVPSVKDCYGALGAIHSIWRPVPGRFRDFIAMPKPNGYQSLHTSVISEKGQPFEVQIRTGEMHRIAEEGIAAHWSYKEGAAGAPSEEVSTVQWLRQYMDLLTEVKDPREFLSVARMNLFPDEVYAFTPKGDVRNFPAGASAIDFAYSIHTDVGRQAVGARVNGRHVPLRTQLRNGDIVEIQTSPNQHPSRDWLKAVRTSKARSKIRQWLSVEERRKSIQLGKDIAEREFRKYRFNPKRHRGHALKQALQALGHDSYDDFLAGVGYGKTSPAALIGRVDPDLLPRAKADSTLTRVVRRALGVGGPQITVKGVGDLMISLARCCGPIPGEEIVGYITRGRGISVHAVACTNVQNLMYDSERRIEVAWARKAGKETHPVRIMVRTDDKKGVLARITHAISEEGSNISHVDARVSADKRGTIVVVLEVSDTSHLRRVLKRLKTIEGIHDAERHVG
ncbi:MAG: RelA/SpoT family protein [Acidobacteriota bacterium]